MREETPEYCFDAASLGWVGLCMERLLLECT
jgi:hypothetical protein